MTAGVLILNPDTIAMATDSAATINNEKITFGNKKLFMLSNNPPMGIMVYGSSKFSDVTVATLISEFIEETNFEKTNNIEEIKEKLIEHIASTTNDMDIDFYLKEFEKTSLKEMDQIEPNIEDQFIKYLEEEQPFSFLENKEFDEKFEDMEKSLKNKLNIMQLKKYFTKFLKSKGTGIIISGFNQGDRSPSYTIFDLCFKYNENLIIEDKGTKNNYNGVTIVPFAQTDVIYSFLRGIDETLETSLMSFIEKIFEEYTKEMVKLICEITKNKNAENELIKYFEIINNIHIETIVKEINRLEETNQNDILDCLSQLPPGDLGLLARSLVQNTIIKRKFSPDIETVGGNINCAIISRLDGFVWINNEIYFDITKNPQFIKRENEKYHKIRKEEKQ